MLNVTTIKAWSLRRWKSTARPRVFLIGIAVVLSAILIVEDFLDEPYFPQCPRDLVIHCKVLENAWLATPKTLAVVGGYVCGYIDPNREMPETQHFIAAVETYDEAERRLNADPSNLNAMTQLDRAKMDLILAARALRSVVGALRV